MELQPLLKGLPVSKSSYFPLPKVEDSYISRLLFIWVFRLLKLGKNTKLEPEHTAELPESERAENEKLSGHLKRHKLWSALMRSQSKQLLFVIFLGNLTSLFEYSGPIYIQLLISYLSSESKPLSTGILIAASFMVISLSGQLVSGKFSWNAKILEIRIRNALMSVIYNKVTVATSLEEGQGVNLLQTDAKHIIECFAFSGYILAIPFQITLAIYLISNQVGSAVYAGIGTIVLALGLNYFIAVLTKKFEEKLMKIRDERIENSKNLLSEIKMIKVYTWESYFKDKIDKIRKNEIFYLRIQNFLYATNIFLLWTIPTLTAIIVFLYYTQFLKEKLDAEKTFVTLTSLILLQEPFRTLPRAVTKLLQCWVSINRIQKLLDSPVIEKLEKSESIKIENAVFVYDDKEILKDINLTVKTGELIAVIGPVASGKSSLLNAVMGEIKIKTGKIQVNDNIAYAPSLDSWVMNGTVKNNILFGNEYDEDWYWKVVDSCCLLHDINSLPAKDSTEIGEKGINLSGGQKARVCLARAVYSNKEIYLLDDPLSSVDSHVANHIFKHCILGILKDKTRILVTHRVNILNNVDRVIIMQAGMIKDINSSGNINVAQEIIEEESKKADEKLSEGKLIQDEDREVGQVDVEVYKDYLGYSYGYLWILVAIVAMISYTVLRMMGDIFLKNWSEDSDMTDVWLPLYIGFRLGSCIFIWVRTITLNVIMGINIGKTVHELLLKSFISAPINLFYDVTPLGRVLNRMSKDLTTIDEDIGFEIGSLLSEICSVSASFIMVFIYFPFLAIMVPFLIYPAVKIKELFIITSRELTRLEAISRSPILNNFGETISGAKFIRVYNKIPFFIDKNNLILNTNARIQLSQGGCGAWLTTYLGVLSSSFLSVLFFIFIIYRNEVSIGVVGLSLAYIIALPADIADMIANLAHLENSMVSVERARHFIKITPEQPLYLPTDINVQDFPSSPSIQFRNVMMRYRPNTELVLKGVNFTIDSGLKVGLVGRTGCGKSSIFLCLLRIVELSSGVILIDGTNIAHLGLSLLRKSITLISQDPLVFDGSLRDNLDPIQVKSDYEIEKAVKEVRLEKYGLDYKVKSKGANMSIGERQLLSLGRAMLTDTKIILFDEATAGIDPETDSKIQDLIKIKFPGKTILAIAHRIVTILDSDLVIVMDAGEVKEIGDPKELVQSDTIFKSLAANLH